MHADKLILALILGFLTSCNEPDADPDYKKTLDAALEQRTHQREIESFVIPDSVNTDLIAATYYEEIMDCHSMILYHDTSRTTASRIRYFGDSVSVASDLVKVNYNTLQSKYVPGESYRIEEMNVLWTYKDGNLSTGSTYKRTDKIGY